MGGDGAITDNDVVERPKCGDAIRDHDQPVISESGELPGYMDRRQCESESSIELWNVGGVGARFD